MLTIGDTRPWHRLPLAVIDFETTGPDPSTCMPVEVSVVRFEPTGSMGNIVAASWSTLLQPGCEIPAGATAVHGIKNDDLGDAPAAMDLMDVMLQAQVGSLHAIDLLVDAVPCGYNGQNFDRTILHRLCCEHEGVPALERLVDWLDPLTVIRHIDRYVGGKGRHKLAATCERHGVELPDAHRAEADATATGRLLYSKKLAKALGDQTISEVLRRQRTRAAEQEENFKAWQAKQSKEGT